LAQVGELLDRTGFGYWLFGGSKDRIDFVALSRIPQ
jgi:hypothetical protein